MAKLGENQSQAEGVSGLRLSTGEARRRFGAARVARLATVAGPGPPHLVPVTFALDGDQVYTAVDSKPKSSRDLRRLRNVAANPRVSLLADHYDEDWSLLWWVRADGQAAILVSPAQMAGPIALLARRYPQYAAEPPAGPVISVTVGRWTGWAAAGGR